MRDITALPLLSAIAPDQAPGLIWAYAARPGEAARMLAASEVAAALAAQDGWVWLHLDVLDQRASVWLQQLIPLPAPVVATLEDHGNAVSLSCDNDMVHGSIVDFHHESTGDDTDLGTACFILNARLLVTGRRQALASLARLRHMLDTGTRVPDAWDLFARLVLTFCRTTAQHLARASAELDTVEDRIVAEYIANDRTQLKAVRRFAVSVHRPLAALVSLLEDEEREEWPIGDAAHAVLHRLSGRLAAIDREVQTANDRARLLQEEMAAELADDTNRSLRALTIVTALLMPGSLVASIFGMNTSDLPFSTGVHGFLGAIVVGVTATALFYWLIRRTAGGRF